MNKIECPHCGTDANYGNTVCKGCQAEVIYGATPLEKSTFSVAFSFFSLIIFHFLGWHLFSGFWYFVIPIILGVIIGHWVTFLRWGKTIRFFRRLHNY